MERRLWAARFIGVVLAGLPLGCASGAGAARVATPIPTAVPTQAAAKPADPAAALIAQAETHLKAGLAAADAGEIDEARNEFDRAIEALASFPGGAYADPRVAECYRRTLETIQTREVELAAAASEEGPGSPRRSTAWVPCR